MSHTTQLPYYLHRKRIQAAKITYIERLDRENCMRLSLALPDGSSTHLDVGQTWATLNQVEIGKYFVLYDSGTKCCMSAEDFENSYARLGSQFTPATDETPLIERRTLPREIVTTGYTAQPTADMIHMQGVDIDAVHRHGQG